MILPDYRLHELCKAGLVSPYTATHVNPASIDLTLSDEFVDLRTGEHFTADELTLRPPTILDAIAVRWAGVRWGWLRRRANRWLREQPRTAVLASTIEHITMPLDCAGVLYLKSSLARAGLDHALAGFVDCGFCGTLTLEVHAHRKITIIAGQRLVQLVLYQMEGRPDVPYQGRYQGQKGPTEAR
jgi:dCTP deaminase